jgi:hypothetical protein
MMELDGSLTFDGLGCPTLFDDRTGILSPLRLYFLITLLSLLLYSTNAENPFLPAV